MSVSHMKWWGWGVEGVAFTIDDKPKLPPFAMEKIGFDLTQPAEPVPSFDDLDVPASVLGEPLAATLRDIVGTDHVHTDDMDRVVHAYGKSFRDLVRLRSGVFTRVPDVVVYPADEAEVQRLVDTCVEADAVLIPFGGGSNIAGSLEGSPDEKRVIVSLDLGRLNRVLEIDDQSGIARVQAGALGPTMEEQFNRRGWTMGHFPDSFTHSTLGGWIATRSSGMQSDKYGDISTITRGMRVCQPGGTLVVEPYPSTSTGPSVREMILGSEGRLGVITEAWVQVHRQPEVREIIAYLVPSFEAGMRAMEQVAHDDIHITFGRVADPNETAFSFSMNKSGGISSVVSKVMMQFLKRRGWNLDEICLTFVCYEGTKDAVRAKKAAVKEIFSEHGGFALGKGPGAMYDQKKFDTPYIRDFLLERGGVAVDVSETSTTWSKLKPLYDRTVAKANAAFAETNTNGFLFCHLSHNYWTGACLYFTFVAYDPKRPAGRELIAIYDTVKRALEDAFIESGGTVSHHHGIGVEHSPWMEADQSAKGMEMMDGLFKAVDPGEHLNPGKIVHEGKPGISVLSED